MALTDFLQILARVSLVAVYAYATWFFYQKAKRSREEGIPNKFFVGFGIVFFTMFCLQVGLTIDMFLKFNGIDFNLDAPFVGYDDPAVVAVVEPLDNLMRPLYILGFIAILIITAFMVYPLEEILGWKKTPLTKILLAIVPFVVLIYVPALTFSLYTFVVLICVFVGTAFGLVLNVGVNLKLAIQTPGEIRKRSMFVLLGFACFYIGLIWSLEVGWAKLLSPVFDLDHDVIFGCFVQELAVLFYRLGFSSTAS